MGGHAVGLGPAGPRSRRALRPLRARRRPADRRRPRRHGLRPSRDGRFGRASRATSSAGRSSTTTSPSGSRTSGRASRGTSGRALRPLARRPHRGRLSPDRPARSRTSRSSLAGARFGAARLEEDASRRSLARVAPTIAIPNGIDGDDPVARPVGRGEDRRRSAVRQGRAPRASAAAGLAEQARVRATAPGGFGIPTLVLHGVDDGLVPAVGVGDPRARRPLVERRTYPGLRHELHNEPEGPAIVDEIVAWLRGRQSTRPVRRLTIPA